MAARKTPPPAFVEPQLAKLVKVAPEGDAWLHELKFDGYRILARLDRGEVTLWSRRGQDWTAQLPTVRAAIAALPAKTALIDGEVAVVMSDGRTSFQALQNAFSGTTPAGLTYFVFDLLHLDGEEVARRPLEERKARLRTLVDGADPLVRFSDHVDGQGGAFFARACAQGLEGIISKARGEPYRSGRHDGWVKTKCVQRQELVIGGFTEPGNGARDGLGALLVGHYRDGALVYAGKVGTGFTQRSARELRAKLDALAQDTGPHTLAWRR